MSVLQSTYYEELPNLDRYGDNEEGQPPMQVHIAASYYEHVHVSLESSEQEMVEINMTIEDAEAVLNGLSKAIASAKKGRALNNA
jgi:hypothetical protein